VHAEILGGSSVMGRQTIAGLSKTVILIVLIGYLFGNFSRDI